MNEHARSFLAFLLVLAITPLSGAQSIPLSLDSPGGRLTVTSIPRRPGHPDRGDALNLRLTIPLNRGRQGA
jgi:hypothetical protein